MTIRQHLKAILVLPVTAAVVIPIVLLALFGFDTTGAWQLHPLVQPTMVAIGLTVATIELVLAATTIRQFAPLAAEH